MGIITDAEVLEKAAARPKRLYDSVEDWIFSETNGVVLSGPFKGMQLVREKAWDDGNLSTKCLGCYEEELHGEIERQIARLAKIERPKIVDLGCAEGYYAVGLARRLPNAEVWGVDICKQSLDILDVAAKINGVHVLTDQAIAEVMQKPDFVLVDVEGDEINYLKLDWFPDLERADILVECHDCDELPITTPLFDRFQVTHDIELIEEGARNPNKFEILRRQRSLHRWMAVCEGRPCTMQWLAMRAKR